MPRPKGALTKFRKKEYTKNINIGKGSLSGDTYASWMQEGLKYIREMKKQKKYPNELKLNYWILSLSAKNKNKVIKYMSKNNKLVCNRIELERLCNIRS